MPDSTVTIVGNMTRDPELRYTTGGRGVVGFGVAVNRRWQNKQTNEWEEEVSFFNVTAWAELAENVAASMNKGNRVIVCGRLQQRSYEDRQGEKKSTVEIVADSIGADLRFATCQIERVQREQAPRQQQRQPDPVYGDEEPF